MTRDSISLPKSALVFWVSLLCLGSNVHLKMKCVANNSPADAEQMGPLLVLFGYHLCPCRPLAAQMCPPSSVRDTSPLGPDCFSEPIFCTLSQRASPTVSCPWIWKPVSYSQIPLRSSAQGKSNFWQWDRNKIRTSLWKKMTWPWQM